MRGKAMPYIETNTNNIIIRTSASKMKPTDIWLDQARIGQTYDSINNVATGIDDLIEKKIQQINILCRQKIISGFQSSALGSPHTYKSDPDYQLNLVGLVVTGVDSNFPASTDGGKTYSSQAHTIAQLQQVLADGKARKQSLIDYSNQLSAQCKNSATETELDAIDVTIGWP